MYVIWCYESLFCKLFTCLTAFVHDMRLHFQCIVLFKQQFWDCGGLVVEHQTLNQEVLVSIPTQGAQCPVVKLVGQTFLDLTEI